MSPLGRRMSDKNQYQALLRSKIRSVIGEARAASVFTHQGVKGAVLEILIGGLFKPFLPSDIGVGTGQIIDSYKSTMSNQIDIILYDKSILPPVLIDDRTGIFPIESVLYTIEVKTTLNATELSAAHEAATKILKFGYLPGLTDESGKPKDHAIEKARSVIFALNSDLTGTNLNEAQRYKKLYGDGMAAIRSICVAGRDYFYDNGEYWIGFEKNDEYDEILAFIGGITNTYKAVSRSRHSPLLGNYVVPESPVCLSIESRKVIKIQVICEGCGKVAMFKPNMGTMDVVVNGAISSAEPCSDCGGKMSSSAGTYHFVKGELIEGDS
jgi:hypothetical protein